MTRLIRAIVLCCVSLAFSSFAYAADELPLKRVVITTSGLALYEHDGSVSGNEDITLPVRLDHVDDILKSLVVMDNKGQLGGVSLPGRQPLSQAFRDLPFSEKDLGSTVSLLNALQGADVQVTSGKETITGKLMNVVAEEEKTDNKTTIVHHRANVLTADGIKSAILESIDHLQFTDKTVQAQLDRALAATFSNRIKDQRNLTISLLGSGERPVSLAYIQEAPLWKSSYRLVLPQKAGDKAMIQGWAVLENTTGQDWNAVNITLMSGSPVTYKQALYESYYVPRPELPVKVMDRILPRVDEGTLESEKKAAVEEGQLQQTPQNGAFARQKTMRMAAMSMNAPAAAPMAMGGMAMAREAEASDAVAAESEPTDLAQTVTTQAEETASQMIFAFPQPVTLPAGHTLMLPFVSHALPAEKLYVYQPETNAQHPLAAIALTNDTGSGLPPGILTIFDQSKGALLHVGDAEMPMVPKAEDRFISFALDGKTKIDQQTQDDRQLGLITVAGGMMNQKVVSLNTTAYTIKAPPDEDRTVVIELPRREGWELQKPEGAVGAPETTATHYRVKVTVAAGKTDKFKLTLRHDDYESVALNSIAPEDLDNRMTAAGRDLPADLRAALEKVKALRAAVYEPQMRLQQIEQEQEQISGDQDRLRENIKTVSSSTDLGRRYLKEMNDQEDRLAQLKQDEKDARQKMTQAQAVLDAYLRTLKV